MARLFNDFYSDEVLIKVRVEFLAKGVVMCEQFLSVNALKAVSGLKWKQVNDPLKNKYYLAKVPSLFQSKVFKEVLSKLIGPIKRLRVECRAFSNGDYTLLYDDLNAHVGVVFFFDVNAVDESWGGYTSFLKNGEEVFRVVGKSNALTIVNAEGLLEFTKYVNHRAMHPRVFVYGVAMRK